MYPKLCIVGIFWIIIIGLNEAQNRRERRIAKYESEICKPRRRHLDEEHCRICICRTHGYGSICEEADCTGNKTELLHSDGECTPLVGFTTRCHSCKCSSAGTIIECVEKRRRCMDNILDELDEERFREHRERLDSFDYHLSEGNSVIID